jgi:predicted AlkP superfamily phosphohydrolase/phosphomutase
MILRILGSAAIAGALLAFDIVLLTLFLNPQVTLRKDGPALLLALFLPYTVASALGLWALALLGALVRGWPQTLRPPIPGLPWFTTLTTVALIAATTLFTFNLVHYRHSVPLEVLPALTASALSLAAACLVLVAVGVDALIFPWRARGVSAAFVVLAASSSAVVPLALRPRPVEHVRAVPVALETVQPARRVVLVGLDGLGPAQLRDVVGRGQAPAFAQLLRRGTHGPLATLRPTEGPPIWTTIMTGRLPRDHGVKSFATYRLRGSDTVYELLPRGALVGLLERASLVSTSPVTSAARRRRALWNAVNAFGIASGTVRVWGTHPPERVQGFTLSPYFHLLSKDPARARAAMHPGALAQEVNARAVFAEDIDAATLSRFLDVSAEVKDDRVPWRRDLLERALAPDLTYERAGSVLQAAYDPPFFATYFYGLDVVGHTFTRFAQPDLFGDVRPEERRRYGGVVDAYTRHLEQVVAGLAASLRSGDVLLLVSGYGMEPLPQWRRAWEAVFGDPMSSGTHGGAPDGLLLAVGDGIKPGASFAGASVLDVTPTVLYLMGLPVARDMEGRVLTEIVTEDFARSHPLTYIPSYEQLAVTPFTGEILQDLPPLPDEAP